MQLALAKVPFLDPARRLPFALAVVGGLAVLLILAVFASSTLRQDADPAAASRSTASFKDLPARPEDIEAHGASARSVLAPDDARARNAAVPFSDEPLAVARSFAFKGSDEDHARAVECLAAAVLYEAGDDTVGQAAVAQVVLNRVRHPAFPATVCGVVYQGSQRSTGCQFTFTCDGSLRRQMPDAAWRRAREVAERALAGKVDRSVGLATHYHTDWVYPYWSPKLRKLARVGTHLFFAWPGTWGGPSAFLRTYRGNEAAPGAVASVIVEEAAPTVDPELGPGILGLPQAPAKLPSGMEKVPLYGNKVRLVRSDGQAFGLLAPADATAAKLVNAALALCAKPGPCQVAAWPHEDFVPDHYPIPEGARGTMVFEYVRAGAGAGSSVRFDCERFPNRDPKACLRAPPAGPTGLSGVRFKSE